MNEWENKDDRHKSRAPHKQIDGPTDQQKDPRSDLVSRARDQKQGKSDRKRV